MEPYGTRFQPLLAGGKVESGIVKEGKSLIDYGTYFKKAFDDHSPNVLPFMEFLSSQKTRRFLEAQEADYETILKGIRSGHGLPYWPWHIFPQMKGLGQSSREEYYGISDMAEARAYVEHPVLRQRLLEAAKALAHLPGNDITKWMSFSEGHRLQASMTLFSMVDKTPFIFRKVLSKFFDEKMDQRTAELLESSADEVVVR